MPISLAAFTDDPLCHGHEWQLEDQGRLARAVALLLLGHHLYVTDLLHELTGDPPPSTNAQIDRLIAEMKAPRDSDHRDGWLFQMISWIAAVIAESDAAVLKAPQPRMADKGLDGLILTRDQQDHRFSGFTICEDKATVNPRATVRDKVWPEIEDFESGSRDSELTSEVTSLLAQAQLSADEIRDLLNAAFIQDRKRYRVSVTASDSHRGVEGRESLFRGYDEKVTGALDRRRAETVEIAELREWMNLFAQEVAAALDEMKSHV